jgi:hypothetical protein
VLPVLQELKDFKVLPVLQEREELPALQELKDFKVLPALQDQ